MNYPICQQWQTLAVPGTPPFFFFLPTMIMIMIQDQDDDDDDDDDEDDDDINVLYLYLYDINVLYVGALTETQPISWSSRFPSPLNGGDPTHCSAHCDDDDDGGNMS